MDGVGDLGETGGSGEGGGRGDAGEEDRKGDVEDEGRGEAGDGGASIAVLFVIPCQTTSANRDVRLGADEETSTEGVSVSSPSSNGSSSELSDISGEGSGELLWSINPFHIMSRREPSVVLGFTVFDSSSLRPLSSTAVWRMLSIPPADSRGYTWRRLMPSMKASLSSHARNGDGGPSNKFSSAQRLGTCRTVFPRLRHR